MASSLIQPTLDLDEEKQELWDRQVDESAIWFKRFERYRLLGPHRTFLDAWRMEQREKGIAEELLATDIPGSWRPIIRERNWRARAEAWDAAERKRVEVLNQNERDRILREGFALQHKRIETLGKIAERLEGYAEDEEKLWSGGLERKFNAALIRELRELLGDIADELGQRVKKQEISGPGGESFIPDTLMAALDKFYGDGNTERQPESDS